MTDIKSRVQSINSDISARNVHQMTESCANIYEALNVVAKRSRQLSIDLKQELHKKLEEFAVSSDAIEEISENKEQIEISKFYERLPNPTIIATEEFLAGEIYYRYKDKKNEIKF